MRKTFFPSALFGLCSTSLLLLGLSSLRTDPRLFAQSQYPAHPSRTSNLSTDDTWLAPDHPDCSDDAAPMLSDYEQSDNDSDIASDAWDTGPVPGEPFANDPKGGYTSSEDSSGYRYYYRFVAEDAWSEEMSGGINADDDGWLWFDDEPKSPNYTAASSESSYSFIDEYSSEEAARYEMAQEGAWQNDAFLAEDDGNFPWYEKPYYFMESQSEIGGRHSRCSVLIRNKGSVDKPDENLMTVADLEALIRREHAESFYQPDYEADVAAGWLFAVNREEDHDLAFLPAGPDEIAVFDLSSNYNDEVEDEAYEDWGVFEDDVFAGFADENGTDISSDLTGGSSETTESEPSSSELLPNSDPASRSPDTETEEDYETWIIVNHDPLVGRSGNDESLSSVQLTDTPWHGEPGEDFVWPEESAADESVPILFESGNQSSSELGLMEENDEDQFEWVDPNDDRYYDDSFDSQAEDNNVGQGEAYEEPMADWREEDSPRLDAGEAWDYDCPGYRASETAPPVGGWDDGSPYRGEAPSLEDSEGFETYEEKPISLRRMGSAVFDLIPQFRLWK